MKKMKRGAMVAALAAAALALTACAGDAGTAGGGDEAAGTTSGDKKTVALVSKGFQHQFWQAVKAGAEEAGQELGVEVTFEGPASETEVAKQIEMLEAAINKPADAIGLAALDAEACQPALQQAKAKKIPVVMFDAACGGDYGQYLAATDNKVAGALAAEHMAEAIGGEGKIAVIGHSQINSTGVDRRDGFVEFMKEKFPNVQIVDIQYGDGDHAKSADIARAMINAHPDLKGIYGTNEGSAIGVVNAAKELNIDPSKLVIVGFDSGSAQIDAIKSGLMLGAVTQDPRSIGRITVENAVKLMNGESVDAFTDTGSFWYDKSNIDDEKIKGMLYTG
ncbi:BMP family ABC transporter substrate-binding protein [Leucobacter sp. OH2974_COT-288]|uniref:Ribose transport system substrate-binding protein n=1 Tax=Canibacter oris TaxID=1365628 RepID=A0A840DKM8_9MICO|nr:ABC transporter substrate-binding protein [Canibacter oris]MBB4072022.1 ribose transport system substrate-binding protein [Canibacter oris]RRD35633.1 BMP family ABC transporter substrate-binding protein [Leucobacter sp. OH2974_COT-288]